jgi:hypothetical protein
VMKHWLVALTLLLVMPSLVHAACSGPGAYGTAVCADSPVRYYRLNESSGTTAADSSGNGVNGTYAGSGVTYSVAGPPGITDTAVTFNGSTGKMTGAAPSNFPFPGNTTFTMEVWVKIPVSFTSATIVQSDGNNWIALTSGGKIECGYFNAGSQVEDSPLSYNDNKWHLADCNLVNNSAVITLYVDGASVASGTKGGSANNSTNFFWGANNTSTFFAGSESQAALYAPALSSGRVAAHFAAGSPASGAKALFMGPF